MKATQTEDIKQKFIGQTKIPTLPINLIEAIQKLYTHAYQMVRPLLQPVAPIGEVSLVT